MNREGGTEAMPRWFCGFNALRAGVIWFSGLVHARALDLRPVAACWKTMDTAAERIFGFVREATREHILKDL